VRELGRVWRELTGEVGPAPVTVEGDPVLLGTRLRVADAAVVSVGLALASAARLQVGQTGDGAAPVTALDRAAAVTVFRSEHHLRVDEQALAIWDPLAGNYRAVDGWVRLHTNYPHHRAAALAALDLPPDADRAAVSRVVAARARFAVEEAVQAAGGAAGALRTPAQWRAHPQAAAVAARPLVAIDLLGSDGTVTPDPAPAGAAGARPTDGALAAAGSGPGGQLRVLDLTRVIAAPTATKVLAALGADVLRLDAPGFAEVAALVPDTTAGKRCARLDLRTAVGLETFDELVGAADVLVCGLRPGALQRLGRPPGELLRRNPRLVVAELSAYGDTGPWAGRRGFDSLVQLVTGIAAANPGAAGPDPAMAPVPLPAQALDHASGWLLTAGILEALHRLRHDGRARRVGVLLARTAAWLQALEPGDPSSDDGTGHDLSGAAPWLEEVDSPLGRVRRVRFPGTLNGRTREWGGPPSPLGSHDATWPTRR
jgi:crotonobetainyl-CoA:carnitine CoA-transferase CaiB-like acyl-CoA transferase